MSWKLSALGPARKQRRHNAMGNLLADDHRGRQFTYNAMDRMAEARQGASVLRHYTYNAWGEQVRKSDGTDTGTTLTLYDQAGHWLGDYDHGGHATQQVVWLDDHPVGLMQAGQTYYVETDHLGTPRVVVDPSRDLAVWRWDLKGEAFGSTAPDEDADEDGIAFVLDMRFPGQRYDRGTGLNYNYQRDYDYLVGRYGQSDPIGLRGGASTYAYVNGSPTQTTDASGRCPWCLVGAIIGAVSNTGFQLYRNGGNWNQIDIQQVGLAAAGGFLSGGLGTLAAMAELGVAGNLIANGIGSGVISGTQQVASNALQGKCLMDGTLDNAAKGALFGFAGTSAVYTFNATRNAIVKASFSNMPLEQQLFVTSNAISGPYLSRSADQWAIGGTVGSNITSNVISNMNQ